ncbi:MAG: hypothetical protein ABI557_14335 [Aureliella sp.]
MRFTAFILSLFSLIAYAFLVSTKLASSDVLAASPNWTAVVSPAGSVRLQRDGREVATLTPGLFEKDWQFSAMSEAKAGQVTNGTTHQGKIVSASGKVVEVQLQLSTKNEQSHFQYRLTPYTSWNEMARELGPSKRLCRLLVNWQSQYRWRTTVKLGCCTKLLYLSVSKWTFCLLSVT